MSREEALYQSLASCGAVLIAFIGVCHEFAGHIVFPWAPALLGGPVGWHGLGIVVIMSSLLLLAGTLRFIRFPVELLFFVVAAIGVTLVGFTAVAHHEFHMFAFVGAAAGAAAAFFHRKAAQLAVQADSPAFGGPAA